MKFFAHWTLVPAMVIACLGAGPAAEVLDTGGFFSADAVQKANAEIKQIRKAFHKAVAIETFATVPSNQADKVEGLDREGRNRFFVTWANERMRQGNIQGVYILVCKSPAHLQIDVDEMTSKKAFPTSDRDKLRDLLLGLFKDKEFDKGLANGIHFIHERLEANVPVWARAAAVNEVVDYAHFFSPEAIGKADQILHDAGQKFSSKVVIESFPGVRPDDAKKVNSMNTEARERYFAGWARSRPKELGIDGVSLLICKEPAHFQIGLGEQMAKKAFTVTDRARLQELLKAKFRKKQFDQGLVEGTALIYDALDKNLSPALAGGQWGEIKDNAGLFSQKTVQEGSARIQALRKDSNIDIAVETFKSPPPGKAKEVALMPAEEQARFFSEWLQSQMKAMGGDGILMLWCQQPSRIEIGVGDNVSKAFTAANGESLRKIVEDALKEHHADLGLQQSLAFINDTLKSDLGKPANPPGLSAPPAPLTSKPETTQAARPGGAAVARVQLPRLTPGTVPVQTVPIAQEQGFSLPWWVIIVLVLVGLWILVGIIRAIFRPRQQPYSGQGQPLYGQGQLPARPMGPPGPAPGVASRGPGTMGAGYGQGYPQGGMPPPGYGQGYPQGGMPPPGYGQPAGGGGGFLSGILGGMFGAAAGSWMYDSFRGRPSTPMGGWGGASARAEGPRPGQPTSFDPSAPAAGGFSSTGADFDQPTPGAGSAFGDNSNTSGGDFDNDPQNAQDTSGGDFDAGSQPDAGGGDFGGSSADSGGGGDFDAGSQQDSGGGDFGGGSADSGGGGGDFDAGSQPDTGGGDTSGSDSGGGSF